MNAFPDIPEAESRRVARCLRVVEAVLRSAQDQVNLGERTNAAQPVIVTGTLLFYVHTYKPVVRKRLRKQQRQHELWYIRLLYLQHQSSKAIASRSVFHFCLRSRFASFLKSVSVSYVLLYSSVGCTLFMVHIPHGLS